MGVKLVASGGGSVEINPPSTSASFIATMPAGTGTVAVNGASTNIVLGTPLASTSGTSIDFTGIPSWVRRITIVFNGVSTNGTSLPQIQLGDSGGIENTGYTSAGWTANTTNSSSTTGFLLMGLNAATTALFGHAAITNFNGNLWVMSSVCGAPTGNYSSIGGGSKTLSDTLDRIRITTVNGTDAFDAGSINIMYE